MPEPYDNTGVHTNVQITIDLNELVWARGEFLKQEMSVNQAEYIAETLRRTLTWDTLYGMIDSSILEFFDNHEHPEIWDPHYGEIQPEPGREDELNKLEKAAKQRETSMDNQSTTEDYQRCQVKTNNQLMRDHHMRSGIVLKL